MAVGLTDLDTFDVDAELVVDLVRSARLASVCGLTRATRVHVGDGCSGRSMTWATIAAPPFDVRASQESVTLDRVTSDTSRDPRGADGMS